MKIEFDYITKQTWKNDWGIQPIDAMPNYMKYIIIKNIEKWYQYQHRFQSHHDEVSYFTCWMFYYMLNCYRIIFLCRCPHCDFAALLDPSVKVFACQNTSCMKVQTVYYLQLKVLYSMHCHFNLNRLQVVRGKHIVL